MSNRRERQSSLALRVCAPFLRSAIRPEGLRAMPVETRPAGSSNRRSFSSLEALGRLLCGIAPWLEIDTASSAGSGAPDLAAFHRLIEISCAKSGPAALSFTDGLQPLVDAAFLAQAVLRAPAALWGSLSATAQENLIGALSSTRAIVPHHNNWLLFSAIIEALFCRLGLPWEEERVDFALKQHEQWYRGDGLYSDGPHLRLDYYNSFVIHPMLTDIFDVMSGRNADWEDTASRHRQRALRLSQQLERLIGPDGAFPPLGRSIAYRGGAFHALAQAALREEIPGCLPPAQVSAALAAVAERTLGADANYDQEGWLRIGLSGHQPNLAERYVSTGSLYLSSTIFLPLGLPEDAAYWQGPDLPWIQQRLWSHQEDAFPDASFDG
jgi:hypothetical protein